MKGWSNIFFFQSRKHTTHLSESNISPTCHRDSALKDLYRLRVYGMAKNSQGLSKNTGLCHSCGRSRRGSFLALDFTLLHPRPCRMNHLVEDLYFSLSLTLTITTYLEKKKKSNFLNPI